MARKSKFAKFKPKVEERIRQGVSRSELTELFPDVPGATMTGWWQAINERIEQENNPGLKDDASSEIIRTVNPEAVEMPDGRIVNLENYRNGKPSPTRRRTTNPENGISAFHVVKQRAVHVTQNCDNDHTAIMAGALALKCLYAEAELPRHILEGTTGIEVAEEAKSLEGLTAEELHRRYQEKLGNW